MRPWSLPISTVHKQVSAIQPHKRVVYLNLNTSYEPYINLNDESILVSHPVSRIGAMCFCAGFGINHLTSLGMVVVAQAPVGIFNRA